MGIMLALWVPTWLFQAVGRVFFRIRQKWRPWSLLACREVVLTIRVPLESFLLLQASRWHSVRDPHAPHRLLGFQATKQGQVSLLLRKYRKMNSLVS